MTGKRKKAGLIWKDTREKSKIILVNIYCKCNSDDVFMHDCIVTSTRWELAEAFVSQC